MTCDRIREIIATDTIGLGSTTEQSAAATRRLNRAQFDLVKGLRRERGLP